MPLGSLRFTLEQLPVIAIDGPAGAGKSAVAKLVASALQLPHIDTGAMYRALTYKAMRKDVLLEDGLMLAELADNSMITFTADGKTILDGIDVSDAIRSPEVSANVSAVSAHPAVRERMVDLQRAAGALGAVLEGRDIGTVVFPDAILKVFLIASDVVRAKRRQLDLQSMGVERTLEEVLEEIRRRDKFDSERVTSPLRKARDAKSLDTSNLTIEQVVGTIVQWANENGVGIVWQAV
ncbi:MAG: (d)CMP kinase [bacterium]|nr:(d)CMP kinase [bacterium]